MKVLLKKNGPILIPLPAGTEVRINGEVLRLEKENLALCRCGASRRKPLCDKAHRQVGFAAPGGVIQWDTPPASSD